MRTTVQIDTLERNRRIKTRDGCYITADKGTARFELADENVTFYIDFNDLKLALYKLEIESKP